MPNISHSDATPPTVFIASVLLSYTNTKKKKKNKSNGNKTLSIAKVITMDSSVNSGHSGT